MKSAATETDPLMPPRLADAFLECYCAPEFIEAVQGDLYELFDRRRESKGIRLAQLWYFWDVIRFFRPYLLKRRKPDYPKARGPIMYKNYFLVALRNFRKHFGYAFLNVTGLAIGIAACILIVLYIQDDLSFDKYHEKANRIYRVTDETIAEGTPTATANTYSAATNALRNEFPEIPNIVRFYRYEALVSDGDVKQFQEPRFFFVDSTVLEMFSWQMVIGNPETVLDEPNSVVLTESTARKYFPDSNSLSGYGDPIGKTLRFENQVDLKITGIIQDVPRNSHFEYDFLGSFSTLNNFERWAMNNWHWPPMYTYLELPENTSAAALESQFPDLIAKYLGDWARSQRMLHLQPLTDIHLTSNLENELAPNSDGQYIIIFSAIAFMILLIACINFMNLSTARSANRAREVGMRQVLGAYRWQLIKQFLSESLFVTFVAAILAIVIVNVLLPTFNDISGKSLTLAVQDLTFYAVFISGIILFVGILSGSYPAFYLSAFKPASTLKGGSTAGKSTAAMLRKGLVVFQFSISIALIIGTFTIYHQLDYMRNLRLGFDKEHIVSIPLRDYTTTSTIKPLKDALKQNANIKSTTISYIVPGVKVPGEYSILPEGKNPDENWELSVLPVDYDFVKTFGLAITDGRDFSDEFSTDSTAIILNEAAVQKLGWESALDKHIQIGGKNPDGAFRKLSEGRVVGVVRNFNIKSLHHDVAPLLLVNRGDTRISHYNYFSVRINPGNISGGLAFIEEKWREYAPNRPFEYFFVDEQFDRLYRAEQRLGEIFISFSLLAIIVACLGLFGLAAFAAEQRTREISVRKVLGASISSIVVLLSKDFTKLLSISILVASPLAYFVMNKWLQNFAYQADQGLFPFMIAGILAFAIAMSTVGFQAIKAAMMNPVDALRNE